ncbi:hypothetical protein Q31b_34310 [Novipirellula aureliae]|uniref:DUF1858 domain-containing protein n=2 Tax=Novipirellula aureliae TaxID=2527966 RepID=A0A5C6DVY2_9BACT|nr:hypothetical protein Q31b_34310 [Novipirellula aureliae]
MGTISERSTRSDLDPAELNERYKSHDSPERSYQRPAIEPRMTVRHVVALYPACRVIFRKYGEPDDRAGINGAPGPFGHFQPLSRFAAEHGVDVDQLLEEISNCAGVPVDRDRAPSERIHRSYLLASLLITLTLGAGWGAHLLASIGLQKSFEQVSVAHVIAHGEAQLWGFLGLFIVGVSLRTVLKEAAATRRRQRICRTGLSIALLSFAGGFAWSIAPQRLAILGIVSAGALMILSASLWLVQWQVVGQKWQATWARAVFMSGFWLTLWATVTFYLRLKAADVGPVGYGSIERLLIIKLAVFGFAMNSIYGFGQMLLPGLLRLGKPRLSAVEASFWFHNVGVLMMFIASFTSAMLEPIGSTFVLVGVISFATGLRGLIGKRKGSPRLEQGHRLLDLYPPLAFFWLLLSLILLFVGDLYVSVSGQPLSHAFTGAVRHALTVGFITTLILGVGQRLLPVLEHNVLLMPKLVAPILILIASGNLLRVSSQVATLQTQVVYAWLPVSAVFEWMALFLFTISAIRQMWPRRVYLVGNQVTERTPLATLLAIAPSIEDKLISRGSAYLVRARSVPSELTIGSFAASENQQPMELVQWINEQLVAVASSRSWFLSTTAAGIHSHE